MTTESEHASARPAGPLRAAIRGIAKASRREESTASQAARAVRFAFLTPSVVEAILTGRHALSSTGEQDTAINCD
ncbi:hypothetical protein [Novosphingobium sp. PC22D]|uniref:hypothetical protein n=1 Tax=Novosphingobium sp. PC22D TaxID=1962403 RepID=UPI0011455716|nr:hypothetical protein [Novosphingobium sp. PC22D]